MDVILIQVIHFPTQSKDIRMSQYTKPLHWLRVIIILLAIASLLRTSSEASVPAVCYADYHMVLVTDSSNLSVLEITFPFRGIYCDEYLYLTFSGEEQRGHAVSALSADACEPLEN